MKNLNEKNIEKLNRIIKNDCILMFIDFCDLYSSKYNKEIKDILILSPTTKPLFYIEKNDLEGLENSLLNPNIKSGQIFNLCFEFAIFRNYPLKYIKLIYNHEKMKKSFDYSSVFDYLLKYNNIEILFYLFNQEIVRKQISNNKDLYEKVKKKIKIKKKIDSF